MKKHAQLRAKQWGYTSWLAYTYYLGATYKQTTPIQIKMHDHVSNDRFDLMLERIFQALETEAKLGS